MSVDSVIEKITNRAGSRDMYYIAPILCFDDISYNLLPDAARNAEVVNQLGVLVDLTLEWLIPSPHSRCAPLKQLSDKLYSERKQGEQPFYPNTEPQIVEIKKQRLHKMNDPKMYEILIKWGIISVLSPEKFHQIFWQEYEERKKHEPENPLLYWQSPES